MLCWAVRIYTLLGHHLVHFFLEPLREAGLLQYGVCVEESTFAPVAIGAFSLLRRCQPLAQAPHLHACTCRYSLDCHCTAATRWPQHATNGHQHRPHTLNKPLDDLLQHFQDVHADPFGAARQHQL